MSNRENKRYSRKEIEKILKRAVDLQREELRQAGGAKEISLDELESIGKEVGIDPELIRTAALEIDTRAQTRRVRGFLGERPRFEKIFPIHHKLSEKDHRRILNSLSRHLEAAGAGSTDENGFLWTTDSFAAYQKGYRTSVSLTAVDDGGELRITEDYSGLAGGLFGGIMGGLGLGGGFAVGFGLGMGTLGSPLFAALLPFGFIGVAYLLARSIFVSVVRRRRRKLEKATEKIRNEAERDSGGATPSQVPSP